MSANTPAERSSFWRTASLLMASLFAAAAPWTIAGAQTAAAAGLLVVLVGVLLRRLRYPPLPRTLAVLVLFLAVQALSIPLGIHPSRSLRFFPGYSWVLLLPFVFWGLLADARTRYVSVRVLVISAALAGYYGLAQHWSLGAWAALDAPESLAWGGYIAVGTLGHHLTYAGVLLPVFFAALGLWLESRRWPWLLAVAGISAGLVFSFARTAWVGWGLGLAVLGALRGRRVFFLVLAALVVVFGISAAVSPALQERLASLLNPDYPRLRLWRTSLLIAADHPWTGAGLDSFTTLFPHYRLPGRYISTAHPHSDLLAVLVETGLLGVLVWSALWVVFFRETRFRIGSRGAPEIRGQLARPWLPDSLRAGVAALLIAGLGQCYATDEEVVQVWWFLAALALILAARRTSGEDSVTPAPRGHPDP
jgi:O-antigen ligase